jgi:hypothetical protein
MTIRGHVQNGVVVLDPPAVLPEGTEVEINPVGMPAADQDAMPPEEIARLLATMDQLEPLDLTDAERAAWEAERQARKEWEKAQFAEQAGKLQGMWE